MAARVLCTRHITSEMTCFDLNKGSIRPYQSTTLWEGSTNRKFGIIPAIFPGLPPLPRSAISDIHRNLLCRQSEQKDFKKELWEETNEIRKGKIEKLLQSYKISE